MMSLCFDMMVAHTYADGNTFDYGTYISDTVGMLAMMVCYHYDMMIVMM